MRVSWLAVKYRAEMFGGAFGPFRSKDRHFFNEDGFVFQELAKILQIRKDNIVIRRMLGSEGEFGQADLGLDTDFAVDVISAVGNYGEIYDRYMGPNGDAFVLGRGINSLWTDGGLIYAPPMR